MISAAIFLPFAGALAVLAIRGRDAAFYRWLALPFSAGGLLVSLLLWKSFDSSRAGFQFEESAMWIGTGAIGIRYHLGLDGLSLPLLALTAFIGFLSVLGSFGVSKRPQFYFFLLLVMQTAMSGVFVALDLILFFIFWEAVLIPMYFLIAVWGSAKREYASWKLLLYTGAGSALMLVGILAVYFLAKDPATGKALHSFDFTVIRRAVFDPGPAFWLYVLFFVGFAVKVPLFPFHTWLPDAHTEAPTIGSVLLAGVLLKMGGYGLLRFNFGLFPGITRDLFDVLVVLAAINIVYGALLSLAQRDMKRMIAYSSISHMGFVLLGMAAASFGRESPGGTIAGYTGAVYQMVSHGVITGLLFFLIGALYERTHTREISEIGGLMNKLPALAGLLLFAAMASLGLPGLSGFVAEFMVLAGSYTTIDAAALHGSGSVALWGTVACAATMLVTAGYLLWLCQRILFGPFRSPHPEGFFPIRGFEIACAALFVFAIFAAGLFPSFFTTVIRQSFPAG